MLVFSDDSRHCTFINSLLCTSGAALEHLVRNGDVPFSALHALCRLAAEGHYSSNGSSSSLGGLSSAEHAASPFASLVPPLLHLALWLMLAPLRLAHSHADVTRAHADSVTAATAVATTSASSIGPSAAAAPASVRTSEIKYSRSSGHSSRNGSSINTSSRRNSGALSDSEANWLVERSCILLEVCFNMHPSARETIARTALVLATTAGIGSNTASGSGTSASSGEDISKITNSSIFESNSVKPEDWMNSYSSSSNNNRTSSQAATAANTAASAAATNNAASAFAAASTAAAQDLAHHEEARVGVAAAKLLARLCRQAPVALLPLAPRLLDASLYAPDFDTGKDIDSKVNQSFQCFTNLFIFKRKLKYTSLFSFKHSLFSLHVLSGDELGSSSQSAESETDDKFPMPIERTKPLFSALAALAAYHPPTTQALLIFVQKKLLTPLPASSSSSGGRGGNRSYSEKSGAGAEVEAAVLAGAQGSGSSACSRNCSTPLSGRAAAVLLAGALIKPTSSLPSSSNNHDSARNASLPSPDYFPNCGQHTNGTENKRNLSAPDEDALAIWVARACFGSGGRAASTATTISPQLACSGLAFFRTRFHSSNNSGVGSSSGGGNNHNSSSMSPHRALPESMARSCLARGQFVRSSLTLPSGHRNMGNSSSMDYSMSTPAAAASADRRAQSEVVVAWGSGNGSSQPLLLGVASLAQFFILGQECSLKNGDFGGDNEEGLKIAVNAIKHGAANVVMPGAAADVMGLIDECFLWELEAFGREEQDEAVRRRYDNREQPVPEKGPVSLGAMATARARTSILAWHAWGAAPWVMPAWPLSIGEERGASEAPNEAMTIVAPAPTAAVIDIAPWEKGFLGAGARAKAVAELAAVPKEQRATIGWATAIGCRLATKLAEGALLSQSHEPSSFSPDSSLSSSSSSSSSSSRSSSSWKPATWLDHEVDVTMLLPAVDRLLLLRDASHVAILAVAQAASTISITASAGVEKGTDDEAWESEALYENASSAAGRPTGEVNGANDESMSALSVERSSERWGGGGSYSDSDSSGEGGEGGGRRRRRLLHGKSTSNAAAAEATAAASMEDEADAAEDAAWAHRIFGSIGIGTSNSGSGSIRSSNGANNDAPSTRHQGNNDISPLGRSHSALLDALQLGLCAQSNNSSSSSSGGYHHRHAAHGLATALHLPLLSRALAARVHLLPPLTAPSNNHCTSSSRGYDSQHNSQKRNWWCYDTYEVRVLFVTASSSSFIESITPSRCFSLYIESITLRALVVAISV